MYVYKVDVFGYSLGSDCPKLICSFLSDSSLDDLSVLHINGETYVYTMLGVKFDEKNSNSDSVISCSYADFIKSRFCRHV